MRISSRRNLVVLSVLALLPLAFAARASAAGVTVELAGSGTGSVISSPAGVDCSNEGGPPGPSCNFTFGVENVSLTATAAPDSEFVGWSGAPAGPAGTCASGSASSCSFFSFSAALTITATFEPKTGLEFPLTITHAGLGTGSVECKVGAGPAEPCEAEYPEGTELSLVQVADLGSEFTGWSEDCTGTASCDVTMDGPHSVTASFEPEGVVRYPLAISIGGTGSGSVECKVGAGPAEPCEAEYPEGTEVSLIAGAVLHSTFTGWSEDCTGTGSCELTMDSAHAVTATFTRITHVLTAEKTGTGAGTVTSAPAGIDCGASCEDTLNEGETITLTASPTAHSTFDGWAGGGCSGTGSCVVTLGADTTVTATFTRITHGITVHDAGTGVGTVTSSPAGINCGFSCAATFNEGETITLSAAPATHSTFAGWRVWGEPAACPGAGSCEIVFEADTVVTAVFEAITHGLTVIPSGSGSVSADSGAISGCSGGGGTCSGPYDEASTVTLTASPAPHGAVAWSGCASSSGDTCTVDIGSAAATVSATFSPIPQALAIAKIGSGSGSVVSAPSGIDCGSACRYAFDEGQTVALSAIAAAGSEFVGFSGGGCGGAMVCDVTLDSATAVTAQFRATGALPAGPLTERLTLGAARSTSSGFAASLKVRAPGPGTLTATGKWLKKVRKRVAGSGEVVLHLKLSGSGRKALKRRGAHPLTTTVKVTFSSATGNVTTVSKKLSFTYRRRDKEHNTSHARAVRNIATAHRRPERVE